MFRIQQTYFVQLNYTIIRCLAVNPPDYWARGSDLPDDIGVINCQPGFGNMMGGIIVYLLVITIVLQEMLPSLTPEKQHEYTFFAEW